MNGTGMKHATSVALYNEWNRLRGLGGTVARGDIDPRQFGALLPDLFLIETELTQGSRFRFCGASIARRYGRDLEGESFLSLWSGEDRNVMQRNVAFLESIGQGIVLGLVAETAGGGAIAFEMILLPLAGAAASCDSAIGCMVRTGGHDDANRVRSRIVSQDVRSFRMLGNDGNRIRSPRVTGAALSIRAPSLERTSNVVASNAAGRLPAGRGKPHLTLVVGSRTDSLTVTDN
jgi:hypothetical protein